MNTDPQPHYPYCSYCGSISVIELSFLYTLEPYSKSVLSCDKHRTGKQITMALSEEQREKLNQIFEAEKDLIKNHPFMIVSEDGSRKLDREACIKQMNAYQEAEYILRAKQQAIVWALEDAIKDESESEKKRIREFDKTHRFKSGLEIEKEKRETRSEAKLSKEEKLILQVMDRLKCSRDKAVEWINGDV